MALTDVEKWLAPNLGYTPETLSYTRRLILQAFLQEPVARTLR